MHVVYETTSILPGLTVWVKCGSPNEQIGGIQLDPAFYRPGAM